MTDPITAITVLGIIVGKIADSLIGESVDRTIDAGVQKLRGDVAQKTFKQSLGQAIHRYTTSGNRYSLGESLIGEKSPLVQEDVAREIGQVLKFDRDPNYQLVGDRWKASVQDPPSWRDFTLESQLLIKFLKEELQATEAFGPIFDSKNLNDINISAGISAKTLLNVEQEINNLVSVMNSQFGNLLRVFSGASLNVSENIRDFSWYIGDKTQDFVGRNFVFAAIEKFFKEKPKGYFVIKGDPGIGKTSFAAEYVKINGCVHHFNSRAHGINRSEIFLRNLCAQLIAVYQLDHFSLPPESTQDGQFLMQLLNEISEKLEPHKKVAIIVDALDEVDDVSSLQGANLLFLPPNLPNGIYIILTTRNTDLRLKIECEEYILSISQDQQDNMSDIREFVSAKLVLPGIGDYVTAQSLTHEQFLDYMLIKSQGNFMYLKYVIPEIERGAYKDSKMEALPVGLTNYYEDHWRRMRVQSENAWVEYKLPIVIALSIVKEPVSLELISEFSQVKDIRRIRAVLHEWQQFLYESRSEYEGNLQKRWRVYHDSFREFIASKDEVEDEHVSLIKAHSIIADSLWGQLFGPDNASDSPD